MPTEVSFGELSLGRYCLRTPSEPIAPPWVISPAAQGRAPCSSPAPAPAALQTLARFKLPPRCRDLPSAHQYRSRRPARERQNSAGCPSPTVPQHGPRRGSEGQRATAPQRQAQSEPPRARRGTSSRPGPRGRAAWLPAPAPPAHPALFS